MNLNDPPPNDASAPIIGWREWVMLEQLRIPRIKAKVDTGARTSSLHAIDIETFDQAGSPHVRFKVHPIQRSEKRLILCQAPVHDVRLVRSSSGQASERIVIVTTLHWHGKRWSIDVTLADRSQMGFRMLIGREALRGHAIVDPTKSFIGGIPKRKKRGT